MSSRKQIVQTTSEAAPIGAAFGDEWFQPSTNKLFKRMIYNNLPSWVEVIISNGQFSVNSAGVLTSTNLADAVGYKGIPQNAKTSQYTLALSDIGKHIAISTGGVVIPENSIVPFPIGASIVVYNDSSTTQSITINSDTLRQAGTTNTGTRTLASYGLATLVKVGGTVWVVSGNVT